MAWCWLAMADIRLGNASEAEQWLENAANAAAAENVPGESVSRRTLLRLMDEARSLLDQAGNGK
jgi:hypothetical protein